MGYLAERMLRRAQSLLALVPIPHISPLLRAARSQQSYPQQSKVDVFLGVKTKTVVWLGWFFCNLIRQNCTIRRTQQTFSNPLTAGPSSSVTVQGDEYFWTPIKGPSFSNSRIYWIQKGDTFNQIALDLGTTPAALKAKNPHISNTDVIKAGDLLHIA